MIDNTTNEENGTSDGYVFSLNSYNAGKSGKGYILSKNITQGSTTHDAATANIGAPWKMPTKAQCQELINYTTHTWVTINGVNGRKFVSESDASKYIFLPAGGRWYDTTHNSASVNGYYWSTIVHSSDASAAQYMYIINNTGTNYEARFRGLSIRGIQ